MNLAELKSTCRGAVATSADANFLEFLHGDLWNKLIPDRQPQVVVRAHDEQDVIAAIRYARASQLKVVVRGGGHNWCQPTLRHGGVLIDLADLNQVISIDPEARRAVVQPIISNREAQQALNAHGLAYPSGHCPQVKLSGYLLGGGMSWNQGVWGHGCESVEAVELVTAEGELITASADQHPDYFWAARGSGSGFFGVATRYHLKLHPLPKAIHGASYYYPIEDAPDLAAWLGGLAPGLAPSVELTLFLLEAPAEWKERASAHGGKICLITATCFADTPEQALAELQPLAEGPHAGKMLSCSPPRSMTFEELFDASGALWPEGLRNRVEAIFSNDGGHDLVASTLAHFTRAPSPISLLLYAFFTGANPPATFADGAFSMTSRIYGGPWTQWRESAADEANTAWHHECTALMRPYVSGYYIGESDSVSRPSNAPGAFSPKSWQHLADLRAKYDPDGVFFGYFDGLVESVSPQK